MNIIQQFFQNKENTLVSVIITHRLILARAHWTKHITWYKIGGRVSANTPRPIWYPSSDFWVKETFSVQCLLYFISAMENKQPRFIESSDGQIKELVANAVPENTKKSTKYAVNVFEGE